MDTPSIIAIGKLGHGTVTKDRRKRFFCFEIRRFAIVRNALQQCRILL